MYADFVKLPTILLRFSSIWKIEIENKYYHFLYYYFYIPVFLATIIHFGSFVSYGIHISMVKDMIEFAKNVSIMAICGFISFKWVYFRHKIAGIYVFVDKLKSPSADPKDDVEKE